MKSGNRLAIGALVLVVFLLLFYQTPLMRSARLQTWQLVVATVGKVFGVGRLSVDQDVSEQLQRLQAENISLKNQLQDYAHLRQELGTPAISTLRSIPASVVGRPVDTFQTQYVLSKGTAEGITSGAPVVIRGTTLLGFISNVSSHSSVVQLLFNPSTTLTAQVNPDDADVPPARGLLTGQHYTSLLLSTIPRDIKIKSGQAVVTAANEQVPYGLVVGLVGEVSNKENEPYQTAQVTVQYAPDQIDAVTVLVNP